jgi:hypothetical protein
MVFADNVAPGLSIVDCRLMIERITNQQSSIINPGTEPGQLGPALPFKQAPTELLFNRGS